MGSSPHVTHAFSRIRFKHLQIVDAITHYGSVHAAARGLNMTQPAISKILRGLEDELGVELFERLPRGVRPTAIGLEVVAYARRTLSETSRFFDAVASLGRAATAAYRLARSWRPSRTFCPTPWRRFANGGRA